MLQLVVVRCIFFVLLGALALTFNRWPIGALGVATTVLLLVVAIWEMRSLRHVRELMEERSHG